MTVLLSLAGAELSWAQATSQREQVMHLKDVILANHVSPPVLDDEFSARVFDSFLLSLDPDSLYFTTDDLVELRSFRLRIDDELSGQGWVILDEISRRYKVALEGADGILTDLANRVPADDPALWQARPAPVHDAHALRLRWIHWLDAQTMRRLCERSMASALDSIMVSAPDIWRTLKARNQREVQEILSYPSGFETHVTDMFLKSLAGAFDPHTAYLSPWEVVSMLSDLSSDGYGFGIGLVEKDDGAIVIDYLVPGGAAWRSGVLHSSDVLVAVGRGADRLDVLSSSYDEISQYLSGVDPETPVDFIFRSASGSRRAVRLKKEKIRKEEDVVKGFVLEGPAKVGYIALPGFYANWENPNASASANDVAREIIKMRRDGIRGLILDIRYNGGGSLLEAVEMAGLFLDEGALGMTRDRDGNVDIIRDLHRGLAYDGPLVVLMNKGSASASEFLAATLKDYNRALLVGSATYGKGTAQDIVPLGASGGKLEWSPEKIRQGQGFADVTVRRFYAPSGWSVQGRGVPPDIALPDILDDLIPAESMAAGALPGDSAGRSARFQAWKKLPVEKLRARSEERIGNDPYFVLVDRFRSEFQRIRPFIRTDDGGRSLSDCARQRQDIRKLLDDMEQTEDATPSPFKVENSSSDKVRLGMDAYMRQVNERYLEYLSHDSGLKEAYHVLVDFISE